MQVVFAEAEPLFQRALAITEKAKGADHPDVATALERLALVFEVTGRYAEAEPLYKRSLAITEKARGPDHPDVRTWLDKLASNFSSQRRYLDAERLYQRAIAITEKSLGLTTPMYAAGWTSWHRLIRCKTATRTTCRFTCARLPSLRRHRGPTTPI